MRQPSLLSSLLLIGFLLMGLILINIYLLQPRLALKLEAPTPLPTVEEMPSPPHSEQVATTMNLIREMASAKIAKSTKSSFHPHQTLRNPFIDPNAEIEQARTGRDAEPRVSEAIESLPQVQMVMIGESQNSALLDNTLVSEGDLYKSLQIVRIVETGIYVQNKEKVFKLPLGVYSTASLSLKKDKPDAKVKAMPQSTSVKEKAALNELLHRLQPLLDRTGNDQNGNRKQKTDMSEGDGV